MKVLFLAIFLALVPAGLATRLVCYFTNWSYCGNTPFKVEDIEPKYCTHIVYSYLGLEDNGTLKSVDPWSDFGNEWTEGGLKKFIKLKQLNPSVKLLLGVGGWNEGPLRFQSIVRNAEKRKTFLESSLNFIRNYKFDGLEINWVYQNPDGGSSEDKTGLSQLVKEMKPKFEGNGFLLSLATSAISRVVDNSYDIPTLFKNVDFINAMTYDFHGSWDKKTGHVAPLYAMKSEPEADRHLNVEETVNRYISLGAIPEKLNVGLVSYGRTFTLLDPNKHDINSPSAGAGRIDPLPYRTFCVDDRNQLWKKFRNEEQAVPYAVAGNQWVGYEDVTSLRGKVQFVKSKKLGGVSFWTLDFDDFKGTCGAKFPLLNAIYDEVNKK